MKELYLCFRLTENEHYCVESDILEKCKEYECELLYYRKLKDGHVPMYREMKLVGPIIAVNRIVKWLNIEKYMLYVEGNPWKING